MATPTFEDLITPETPDSVLSTLLSIATDVGLDVSSWASGAVTRTILTIAGFEFADLSNIRVTMVKSGFLDFAEGEYLTLLADQVYGVTRVVSSFAQGTTTLINSTVANIVLASGALRLANTSTGATYTTTAGITVPASGSANVTISADQAGIGSDAAPGEVTTVVNTILGLASSNAGPVLGSDGETDEQLRVRCRESLGAASPDGPKEIYSYVAKTLGTTTLPITRTRVFTNLTTGTVSIYIANDDGAPPGGDVTLVDTAIHNGAEPLCVTANAFAAGETSQGITYTAYVQDSSLTDGEIEALVVTAVENFTKVQPIGGVIISGPNGIVDAGAIESAIFNALPAIKSVSLAHPSSDVTITPTNVMTLGSIAPTVVRL